MSSINWFSRFYVVVEAKEVARTKHFRMNTNQEPGCFFCVNQYPDLYKSARGNMAESRFIKRHRKRISVNFGIDKAEKVGFTDDINYGGLFIRSAVVARPGATIRVEIRQPRGLIAMLAEVRWTKKVPSNVLYKLKGGMGVQIQSFEAGEEIYHSLCDELFVQRGE